MTSFSRVIMDAHAVTIAVELRQAGEARKHARRAEASAIPSQPRRGRHLIEAARAWRLAGDDAAALGTWTAPTSPHPRPSATGYARRMTMELAKEAPTALRRDARDLAGRIGLLV